ncbi:MAG: sigma-70 family RNA polymerase sigma factor [Ignavibacteria bacterium]|nr:sigma-70 family RNA polymerase sigma factor [Ignavibacteria bacterium]
MIISLLGLLRKNTRFCNKITVYFVFNSENGMLDKPKYKFLIQQYKNKIYTYSIYMLRNKIDAEEVTQEVMIKIWKNIDQVNALAAKTWIMKTTNNLCIDYLRKRAINNKREVDLSEDFEGSFSNKSNSDDPSSIVHNKMVYEKIKEEIIRLPENLKSVFVMYEIQGLKYKEISISLKMPINSVKVYLLRARKNLQKELKKYEAD